MQVVYFSKNSWWDARKARKVLLPLALSELAGLQVLLVNAAVPIWSLLSVPHLWCHPMFGMKVLTPKRVFPLQRFEIVRKFNQWFRWKSVCKQLDMNTFKDEMVFLFSDPEDIFLASFAQQAGFRCYFDWTEKWDEYSLESGMQSQSRMNHMSILNEVSAVIVVSRELEKEAKSLGISCLHLQNAVSDQFIQQLEGSAEKEDPMEGIPKPRAIHVGSYNPAWIHWDWLIHAANQNPAISFCMIGGGGEDDMPAELPNNIYLLGRIQYEDIPAYLRHSQACMLLYKEKATAAGDPTKLYEYLATGLPIIASPHPRCLDFQEYIYVARDAGAFNNQLHLALEEHGDEREKRVLESKKHTWSIRAKQLLAWLKG